MFETLWVAESRPRPGRPWYQTLALWTLPEIEAANAFYGWIKVRPLHPDRPSK